MTIETVANPDSGALPLSARTVALIAAYNEDRFIGSAVLKSLRHASPVIKEKS
jgi:hypothetical protein